MEDQSAEAKLHELRSKTNRQLASLISHKLDRGLAFARVLESEGRTNWASMEHFVVNAEKALTDAAAHRADATGAAPPGFQDGPIAWRAGTQACVPSARAGRLLSIPLQKFADVLRNEAAGRAAMQYSRFP